MSLWKNTRRNYKIYSKYIAIHIDSFVREFLCRTVDKESMKI